MHLAVVSYQKQWVATFQKIATQLYGILDGMDVHIAHIGSTSVPGLAAKPIIDIMVGIPKQTALDEVVKPMVNAGYSYFSAYNEQMPQRRFFVGFSTDLFSRKFQKEYAEYSNIPFEEMHPFKETHVHIWEYQGALWNRHLAFKEYLIHHPEDAEAYGNLKKQLSQKDWVDGNAYNKAKNEIVKRIEDKARRWFKFYSQKK